MRNPQRAQSFAFHRHDRNAIDNILSKLSLKSDRYILYTLKKITAKDAFIA
jgi:hypothetical protein